MYQKKMAKSNADVSVVWDMAEHVEHLGEVISLLYEVPPLHRESWWKRPY